VQISVIEGRKKAKKQGSRKRPELEPTWKNRGILFAFPLENPFSGLLTGWLTH
jgi:hypothetical protein